MRSSFKFEVCANGVESCIEAQNGGADRVELCAGIPEGGTTPSYGEIKVARKMLTRTRLHVIIRPRGGDFLYSALELEKMGQDIDLCRSMGVDGVVFGCLTADGDLDVEANKRLARRAGTMSLTFHRAFDRCREPEKTLEQLIELGFERVLTSGQQPTADKGIDLLGKLNQQADGRIILLAGSGVNENNIRNIYEATGIREYHFSARVKVPSGMVYHNEAIYMGTPGADENCLMLTSADRVRNTISSLTGEPK